MSVHERYISLDCLRRCLQKDVGFRRRFDWFDEQELKPFSLDRRLSSENISRLAAQALTILLIAACSSCSVGVNDPPLPLRLVLLLLLIGKFFPHEI